MKKNGYTVIELVVVLAVFSVGYFAATWIISGKVNVNFEEELYEEKIVFAVIFPCHAFCCIRQCECKSR